MVICFLDLLLKIGLVMKILKFTFFSVMLSSVMMVDAKGQGPRRDGDRPGQDGPHRIENNGRRHEPMRPQHAPQRMEDRRGPQRPAPQRIENHRPNHGPAMVKNDHRAPIRIQQPKHHSYGKPVPNFDHRGYHTYHHNHVKFYGNNGLYYKFHNNAYVRFAPPIGFNIQILPVGHISINIGSRPYYFYEGVYYERHNRAYRVVQPPIGALVYELPYGYEKINYHGKSLYEFAGVLYDKVYQHSGVAYEIVGYLG